MYQDILSLIDKNKPLQIIGVINAFCALMAQKVGFSCIYLSGAGVANANYGLPDLGITSRENIIEEIERISLACELPLLVDVDTGWGNILNIQRTIKMCEHAGAAGIHIEDQDINYKKCGHLPHKKLISSNKMCDHIKAAVDARNNSNFAIIARTDAVASEGLEAALIRAKAYINAGADAIFAEAIPNIDLFKQFSKKTNAPILANATEFGRTPIFSLQEYHQAGINMVLYPLSAWRAMNNAAMQVYQNIYNNGDQKNSLATMQTREELYEILNYNSFENQLHKESEHE